MQFPEKFDVIVVGGGHAGTEAALASARMGRKTLLLTHSIETIGQMSCNPAIGGIGKAHLAKEIDALGGEMAKAADKAGIHFRILNRSKGPAVRATRAQADRQLYKISIREKVESQENLWLFQQSVEDLIIKHDKVQGVVTKMGVSFLAGAVVLTVGTFLAGKMHIGEMQLAGGRAGCPPSNALAERLRSLPFEVGRLKTGTPARLDGRTIDFSQLEKQPGDEPRPVFSFMGDKKQHPRQVCCYITHTNERSHDVIRAALDRSPLFTGAIQSRGPRYCPSIEDKVSRFAEKSTHQIFLEPEGLTVNEFYPNGISTSLPFDVQLAFIRTIKGLENAFISRPGYAIEYDFFNPQGLKPTLETKYIKNLFFAGQINGTTGYEEAGAQGLMAGINAARAVGEQDGWYLKRNEAYIGVLIDDLITHGTIEPYRMFTSRAEHRLLLREDNADLRLTEMGMALGLISSEQQGFFKQKKVLIESLKTVLKPLHILSTDPDAAILARYTQVVLTKEHRVLDLLTRPEISIDDLVQLPKVKAKIQCLIDTLAIDKYQGVLWEQALKQVEIQTKYAGYIERQTLEIQKTEKHENTVIPNDFVYKGIPGLSAELTEKLMKAKPTTIGMASRIPGMTPAAVSLLLIYLKKAQLAHVAD